MEGALLPFTEYEPGPRPCTPPVSPRGSQDPPTCAPVQVGPGKQGADLPSFLCLGPCTPAGNSDPPLKLLVILGRHTRVAHTPVATCPAAWVLLHPPVCTHRHGACFVRHETVPSLTHTPHHHVCTHVPGARVRGRVKNTRSPLAACSDSPSALTAPERRTCGGSGGHMCAHVQAQTVHTCASHEKMFISYMDVQTCMARKTPSLHVHRMEGSQGECRGLGSPLPLCDLEQAPPPASVPPRSGEGVGPDAFKVGPAHLDLPCLPLPGAQESSPTQLRAQGGGRPSSVGSAERSIPPGTPGWAAALLASRPWTRRPWTHSAPRPAAGSFSGDHCRGGLTARRVLPLPEHLCGGWRPLGPSPTGLGASSPPPRLARQGSPRGPGLAGPAAWPPQRAPPPPHMRGHARAPRAQTHRPQSQWQTRSSPRRCGRM